MVVNQKVTGRASSVSAGLALGAGISMGITLILSVCSAWLISAEYIREEGIGYLVMIILIGASAVGAWFAGQKIKRMKIQMAALTGVLYYAMLLAATALFFGGQYEGMGTTLAMILLGSGVGGLTGSVPKRSFRKSRHKNVFR